MEWVALQRESISSECGSHSDRVLDAKSPVESNGETPTTIVLVNPLFTVSDRTHP